MAHEPPAKPKKGANGGHTSVLMLILIEGKSGRKGRKDGRKERNFLLPPPSFSLTREMRQSQLKNIHGHEKEEDGEDGDEEGLDLLPRALPVEVFEDPSSQPVNSSRPSKRVRHDGPPRTGAEYLLMVRHEAAACPQVVVAKNRTSLLNSSPTSATTLSSASSTTTSSPLPSVRHSLLEGLSSSLPAALPAHLLPSPEWIDSFLLTFASWRLNLERLASSKTMRKTTKVPKLEDNRGWRTFCLGSGGDEENPGTLPTTSLVSSFNQRQTLQLIQYHTGWLADNSAITPQQARWLFSLLLKVDKVSSSHSLSLPFGVGHEIFVASLSS